jgi:hypothetical protein
MSYFSFQQVAYQGSNPKYQGRVAMVRTTPDSSFVDARFDGEAWREFYARDFGLPDLSVLV